jgi:hypothetical protein
MANTPPKLGRWVNNAGNRAITNVTGSDAARIAKIVTALINRGGRLELSNNAIDSANSDKDLRKAPVAAGEERAVFEGMAARPKIGRYVADYGKFPANFGTNTNLDFNGAWVMSNNNRAVTAGAGAIGSVARTLEYTLPLPANASAGIREGRVPGAFGTTRASGTDMVCIFENGIPVLGLNPDNKQDRATWFIREAPQEPGTDGLWVPASRARRVAVRGLARRTTLKSKEGDVTLRASMAFTVNGGTAVITGT